MALYAIGDLHLSLGADKPMDVFGGPWENYVEKIRLGFSALHDDDVCVLCGDLAWGMTMEQALPDFQFIEALPGKKILLKGNHDFWWSTAKKAYDFFEAHDMHTMDILNNNCYFYGDYAICGTRGWFYEEDAAGTHTGKMLAREAHRASKHCLYGIALCRGNLQSVVGLSYGLAYGQRKRIFVGAQVAQFYIKRV